jgi:hypothetical protein
VIKKLFLFRNSKPIINLTSHIRNLTHINSQDIIYILFPMLLSKYDKILFFFHLCAIFNAKENMNDMDYVFLLICNFLKIMIKIFLLFAKSKIYLEFNSTYNKPYTQIMQKNLSLLSKILT